MGFLLGPVRCQSNHYGPRFYCRGRTLEWRSKKSGPATLRPGRAEKTNYCPAGAMTGSATGRRSQASALKNTAEKIRSPAAIWR